MKSFSHVNAKTVKEAIKILKSLNGKAKLMAGGTDLLGALKDKILPEYPETIVNIKTIARLDYIKEDARQIKIGALAKLSEIAASPIVMEKYQLLAEAAKSVATPQIRRMGTIGGNIYQDLRCWYYRYPHHIGGRISCYLKSGKSCYALTGDNRYHSIFGGCRTFSTPCSSNCPAKVDIPSYLSRIREGDLAGAAQILLETNPFPSITGRVCPQFCGEQCNRSEFDEAVSIRDIERYMGDYILDNAGKIVKPPENDTGKSVAIIGSGPAGLSAANYLRMSGHRVIIFERMEEPGGMLAYCIPSYRLPNDIVRRAVKTIENTGVEFRLKTDVGKDITLEEIRKDFGAVFLASGAWRQPSIGLEGEKLTRAGLEFLTGLKPGAKEVTGKRVLVIGGGNVAIDAARTALRLGAGEVTIAYRRSRQEMPAGKEEIAEAEAEGIKINYLSAPVRILGKLGKATGVEFIRMELGAPDAGGRRQPISIKGSEFVIETDMVISAIGQTPDLAYLPEDSELKVSSRGTLEVDVESSATSQSGIFAGGDAVLGPTTVIEAIAAGQRAAVAIDLYLGGTRAVDTGEEELKPFLKFNTEYLKKTGAARAPKALISERSMDAEDFTGLDSHEIEQEANRCFNCSCVAVNSSDIAVALVALGAKVKIAGAEGVKTIPIEDFFGSARNILGADDLVTEIQIPRPPDKAKQTFLKFRLREAIDFPIVSVASVITADNGVCRDARIALGAVAPRPVRATGAEQTIKGKVINDTVIEAASAATVSGALPLNLNAYKVNITQTLVKRALSAHRTDS